MAGLVPAIHVFRIALQQDVDARDKAGHDEGLSMLRKILFTLIVLPLAAVIIAFAVANRQAVTVSFDPFSSTSPAYAATLPLFALIFSLLIFGVLIGGVAAWIGQSKWRRTARKLDADVRALHQELEIVRRRFASEAPPGLPEPTPYTVIRPSIP